MPDLPERSSKRRFIAADEGRQFAAFDLTGETRRNAELVERLTSGRTVLGTTFTQELRRLLNHGTLRAAAGEWQPKAPEGVTHWLSAFTGSEPEKPVLLGMDSRSLYSVSELFFGGQPHKLSDKHLANRTLTDTEERLVLRVFNALLAIVCKHLKLGLDDWQSRWLDTAPGTPALWTTVEVNCEHWSLSLHCGWPLGLLGAEETQRKLPKGRAVRLEDSLEGVAVRLKVQLAHLVLNLEDLSQLNEGDILPIDLRAEVTASAGDLTCIRGQVCEHDGQLALRVMEDIGDLR